MTFAALQQSEQIAFNPVKLVESLKLRTTEQQDAQEYAFQLLIHACLDNTGTRFSKLFMAHLDTEFQQQANPSLKSLIADQVCPGSLLHVLPSLITLVSRKASLRDSLREMS